MFSVHLFKVDKAFGGHEEGGWWFEYGIPEDHYLNKKFDSELEAEQYLASISDLARLMNQDRASIDSVLSAGVYRFLINEGEAVAYPSERPYYC